MFEQQQQQQQSSNNNNNSNSSNTSTTPTMIDDSTATAAVTTNSSNSGSSSGNNSNGIIPPMMIFDTSNSQKRHSVNLSSPSLPSLANGIGGGINIPGSPSININNNNNNSSSGSGSTMSWGGLPFISQPNLLSLSGDNNSNTIFGSASNSPSTGNNLFVNSSNGSVGNSSGSNSVRKDTSVQRRRRHGQSKSVSYTNLSMFQPQNQQQQQQQQSSLSASSSLEHLDFEEDGDYIMEYCSVLKDRLKQLAQMLDRDQSELNHKDQEIELLNSRVNRYNMEIREKEEENEKMALHIKELEKQSKSDASTIASMRNELEEIKNAWVDSSEAAQWKEQIETLTNELESKDQELETSRQRIDILTDQVRREKELNVVARTEAENAQRQYRTEREEYFKELDTLRAKVKNNKEKKKTNDDRVKAKEREVETAHKAIEKIKLQLSASEIELLDQRNINQKLQNKLVDEERRMLALSSSQQSMTQELKQVEGERLAIIGLMNKNETEIEERVSLLMSECAKSNEINTQLNDKIRELERKLSDEKLNKYLSTISLTDPTYSIDERKLIRLIQVKDEEIQRMHKQVQRLQIDASTLTTRYKKMEESMTENNNQLHQTKKSLRNYRKELSKMTQELLYLSDENYNESIQITNNYNSKRKSIDLSDLSKMIQAQDKAREEEEEEEERRKNGGAAGTPPGGTGNSAVSAAGTTTSTTTLASTFNSSPLKNNASFLLNRRERGLSSPQPINRQLFTPPQSPGGDTSLNTSSNGLATGGGSPTSTLNGKVPVDQLEDMLDRARSANIGYRLHIQFLSKEIKTLEKDLQQQKEFNNTVITRLNFDLEESRRLNTRIRKAFLHRFDKEDDIIFLDYYSLTGKFHPPINSSLQVELSAFSSPLSSSSSSLTSSLSSSSSSINHTNSNSNIPVTSSITPSSASSLSSLSTPTNQQLQSPLSQQQQPLSSSTTITQKPILKSALKNSNNSIYNSSSNNNNNDHNSNNTNTYNNINIDALSPITSSKKSSSSFSSPSSSQNYNNNSNNDSFTDQPSSSSKVCNRCSKEFSLFTRKHQCISCRKNYCSECCNTKTKICTFCPNVKPNQLSTSNGVKQ